MARGESLGIAYFVDRLPHDRREARRHQAVADRAQVRQRGPVTERQRIQRY
jgi:hypothetical protein